MYRVASNDDRVLANQMMEPRQGFWGWWLNLTAPPRNAQTTASPGQRELLRKAELTGYFLFVLIFFSIFDLILAIASLHISSIGEILVTDLLLVGVGYLNQRGYTRVASAILIACVMVSIMFVISFTQSGKGGADLFPTYDFFIYPIIIGSLFLDRRLIFPFTFVAIAFIIFNLLFQTHSPEIESAKGSSTFVIWVIRPATVLFVVGLVGWIGARSVERSLLRADHAEELVAAEQQVSSQARQIAEQKAQLEYEISQILLVHKEAAAGNYSVRAPVRTNEVIWQIGRSLNNLLARYEHFARDRQELVRTQADIEKIAQVLEANRHGQTNAFPVCQSIAGKRLLAALSTPVPVDVRIQKNNMANSAPHSSPPNVAKPLQGTPAPPSWTPPLSSPTTGRPLPDTRFRSPLRKTPFEGKKPNV